MIRDKKGEEGGGGKQEGRRDKRRIKVRGRN